MDKNAVNSFPYSAITISILARFIFMFLLYKNKSANTYSLTFCLMNMISSILWLTWSIFMVDLAMTIRSSSELFLLLLSAVYIIINKIKQQKKTQISILPT